MAASHEGFVIIRPRAVGRVRPLVTGGFSAGRIELTPDATKGSGRKGLQG